MPASASSEPDSGADPEDGRAIALVQLAPLDERRSEGVVGEDDDEAREDEHHRREAPVVRREQPRERSSATTMRET